MDIGYAPEIGGDDFDMFFQVGWERRVELAAVVGATVDTIGRFVERTVVTLRQPHRKEGGHSIDPRLRQVPHVQAVTV